VNVFVDADRAAAVLRSLADLEAMLDARAVDGAALVGWVVRLFGPSDSRAERLSRLIDG
jgi:hypothetical protein